MLKNITSLNRKNTEKYEEMGAIAYTEGEEYTVNEKSYQEYMSSLALEEMHMLYTAYHDDFVQYQYDPCDGLPID